MKDYRITVRFPAELRRRLKEAARRTKRRESDLIRGAVERQLKEEESSATIYDRAAKAGLIAVIQSGPRDLSTNAKYFNGFGES
jgi:predicted DNA-binding protein